MAPTWATTSTARMFSRSLRSGKSSNAAVPKHSWSVFHPKAAPRAALHPAETLRVTRFPHLNLVQTHVNPSRFQTQLMRWGSALAVVSAVYQFATNLHTVPITGRTQVVVLSREEECELGDKTVTEMIESSDVIESGSRHRMCVDVASVSEHLFPREYDWRIWLVDSPSSANACCAPGGKIVVYSGLLDLIDFAVEKGICKDKHDALAVVLAHEIGHALARHTAESTSYLPLLYLQAILGLESPLLRYIFQFAWNLPFSRKQEMEADHIGLMLMASACYDPREAPRVWRGFTAYFSEGSEMSELEMSLDFYSTHPSNKKRERRLDSLVPEALALQERSSWCFELKNRVLQLLHHERNGDRQHHEETAFMRRVHRFNLFQEREPEKLQRRATVGTIHEMENRELARAINEAASTTPARK